MRQEMTVTRRTLVRWGAAVSAIGLAGCTGTDGDTDESTTENAETSTEIDADAPFEATLVVDSETVLFTAAEIASVGSITESERTGLSMPVELTDEGTESVIATAREVDLRANAEQAEIVVSFDGERVNSFGIAASLVETWVDGEWDGSFVLTFEDREQAETIRDSLLGDGVGA